MQYQLVKFMSFGFPQVGTALSHSHSLLTASHSLLYLCFFLWLSVLGALSCACFRFKQINVDIIVVALEFLIEN